MTGATYISKTYNGPGFILKRKCVKGKARWIAHRCHGSSNYQALRIGHATDLVLWDWLVQPDIICAALELFCHYPCCSCSDAYVTLDGICDQRLQQLVNPFSIPMVHIFPLVLMLTLCLLSTLGYPTHFFLLILAQCQHPVSSQWAAIRWTRKTNERSRAIHSVQCWRV